MSEDRGIQAATHQIAQVLSSRRWVVTREADLQVAIATAFDEAGILYEREVVVAGGRLDFLVGGIVAVEVKTKGGLLALVQQVGRYAEGGDVRAVLVAVTRRRLMFPARTVDGILVECVLLPTL